MESQEFLRNLLIRERVPATGLTEVGSLALATGWAMQALGDPAEDVEEITLEVDKRTYKNALGVGIPGTGAVGEVAMGATSAKKVSLLPSVQAAASCFSWAEKLLKSKPKSTTWWEPWQG